jgi:hypothetical protein
MSRCSPLGEAAAAAAEAENVEEITISVELERAFGQNLAASDGEGHVDDNQGEGASNHAKLRACYFGSSTITVGKIKEMLKKG